MDEFLYDVCKNCGGGIIRFKNDPVKTRWNHLHGIIDDHNEGLRIISSENCPIMKAVPCMFEEISDE